jgi:hypothetical protein
MKTSMQKLIEELKSYSTAVSKENNLDMVAAFNFAIDLARLNIEKEKEQIQKAFSDGQETPINHPTLPHYSRDEYYNDNYNN